MTKIRKDVSAISKEKRGIETGKIMKIKKIAETLQMKKSQENSPQPARTTNLKNLTSATPFSPNIRITSTPMNNENQDPKSKERHPLVKLSSRLALSPIFKSLSRGNVLRESNEKGENVEGLPKNPPKGDAEESKFNPNVNSGNIRKRKSFGVRRIAPLTENTADPVNKKSTEGLYNRLSLRKQNVAVELLNSSFQSSKPSSIPKQGTVHNQEKPCSSSESSESPNAPSNNRKPAVTVDTSSGQNNTLVNRLRSDWSNTTCEASPTVDQNAHRLKLRNARDRQKENSTRKLRVRLKKTKVDAKCSSNSSTEAVAESPTIDRITRRTRSKVQSGRDQIKESHCKKLCVNLKKNLQNANHPSPACNSPLENSLVKKIKSDWSHTTLKETLAQLSTVKNNLLKQTNKRRLAPLVELPEEDTIIPTEASLADENTDKIKNNNNDNEDEYSSSAEFQSDDEGNNTNRSKRAPTWKDLLDKSGESSSNKERKNETTGISDKRSRRIEAKANGNSMQSTEKQLGNTTENETNNNVNDNCQIEDIETNKTDKGQKEEEYDVDTPVTNRVPFKEIQPIDTQNQESVQEAQSVCEEEKTSLSSEHDHTQNNSNDNITKNSDSTITSHLNNEEPSVIDVIDLRCPVKFFHSRIENSASPAQKSTKNLNKRRTSKRKKERVYEFLSQSSSESNNNQADDVIQKMIKTGKVVVAKHRKGTGMNVIPRNRAPRKKKQNKAVEEPVKPAEPKPTEPKLTEPKPVQPTEKPQQNIEDDSHFDDAFNFDDPANESFEEEQIRDQRGFSNLARSAMIKQAGKIQKPMQRKSITDKKKLLAMAMKIVNQSTPIRKTPQPINGIHSSPMSGNKSPWRVDDNKLPSVFYLGRDSNNLPSFSSDYIPMTPCKNKSKSMSSFSSNDSNGENQAPSGDKVITNEANLKALTNTRKTMPYRSPLKAINILDVVNLPPLALHSHGLKSNDENTKTTNVKETIQKSASKSLSNIYEDISNSSKNSNRSSKNNSSNSMKNISNDNQYENQSFTNSRNDVSNNNATNLFGFEEFIDEESNDSNISVDKTILPNKDALKERLERLKNLRPKTPVAISNKNDRIKPVFDNDRPKQRNIKQMLCSTMIGEDAHNKHRPANHNFNEAEDLSNLFKDLEPETSFNDSLPRRTYNRPFKRKRKMLSNLAIILDSDVSEDENEEFKPPAKKNYKPKQKRVNKNDIQLNKFVNEFNEMCKEVSQYELIVE